MNFKIRLKNKAFWVACIGLIVLILQYIQGFVTGVDLNVPLIERILNAIVLCAVTLGVLIDPTTPTIGDEKKEEKKGDDANGTH